MPRQKKPDIIPQVDIINSGLVMKDPNAHLRNDEGYYMISRSKKSEENRKIQLLADLEAKKKELMELEEMAKNDIGSKEDIKSLKKKKKKKDKKKEKKEAKKSKKKNDADDYLTRLSEYVPEDLSEYINNGGKKGEKKLKKKEKKKKKKQKEIKGLTVKEKKKYSATKDKKSTAEKSEIAERFKDVEKITKENIKEVDETLSVVNERISDIMKSSDRVRGKDTALANYLQAKTSLISTKQKAATDILSARAKVYDIELRKEKNANSANSDIDLITRVFPGIAMNKNIGDSLKNHISKSGKNKDSKKKKNKKSYDNDLFTREKELIKSGDIEYTGYDKNIEWEGKFDIAIKKSFTTQEWKFVAIDKDGNIMPDVPKDMFPSKKTMQLIFDDEKDVAIDRNSNRAFQVFQVPMI